MATLSDLAKKAGYADLGEAMGDKVNKLNRGTDAAAVMQAGQMHVLGVTPGDPGPTWEVTANELAASVQIPFTILFGQQTGRLASDEDKTDWAIRRNTRRNGFLTDRITALLERFWTLGIIDPPTNGEVTISWTDLLAPGEKEKIENASKLADIVQKTSGFYGGEPPFTANELREIVGLDPLPEPKQPPNPNDKVTTDDPLADDTGADGKVGLPIVPRSKVDPTRSAKQVSAMFRDIEDRYLGIKRALKLLFDQRLTGREREVNSHNWHFVCHYHGEDVRLYQVNAGKFIYGMSAQELADLPKRYRLFSTITCWKAANKTCGRWIMSPQRLNAACLRLSIISQQSQVYASQTTLQQLLSSPGYLNQISAARLTTFSDWKVISDTARGDLTNIIIDAVARGVNPRETAGVISKRLDVSMSKAKTIAQTEQVGALRQAQWNETDWAADRRPDTGLLWLSALKPTTRSWHASRHGKVYHRAGARLLRGERSNRYNCYCSQIPVLLNDDGSIFNEGWQISWRKSERCIKLISLSIASHCCDIDSELVLCDIGFEPIEWFIT